MRLRTTGGLAALFLLCGAVGAQAARGIVTKKPGSGTPTGRIVMVDPEGGPGTAGDDIRWDRDPYSETDRTLAPGDLVTFAVAHGSDCGTVAQELALARKGRMINADAKRVASLDVGPGDSVLVVGATIDGAVSVIGGVLVLTGGASVGGKLDANNGAFLLAEGSALNGPTLSSSGSVALILRDTSVEGVARSSNDGMVVLDDVSFGGAPMAIALPAGNVIVRETKKPN